MLVLSRMRDEKIVIGAAGDVITKPIELTVVDIRSSGKVRFGIDAPQHITADRFEVYEAKKRDGSIHDIGIRVTAETVFSLMEQIAELKAQILKLKGAR